jgi:hypothetical protein
LNDAQYRHLVVLRLRRPREAASILDRLEPHGD